MVPEEGTWGWGFDDSVEVPPGGWPQPFEPPPIANVVPISKSSTYKISQSQPCPDPISVSISYEVDSITVLESLWDSVETYSALEDGLASIREGVAVDDVYVKYTNPYLTGNSRRCASEALKNAFWDYCKNNEGLPDWDKECKNKICDRSLDA